jgi:hypothetical protein
VVVDLKCAQRNGSEIKEIIGNIVHLGLQTLWSLVEANATFTISAKR